MKPLGFAVLFLIALGCIHTGSAGGVVGVLATIGAIVFVSKLVATALFPPR